MSRTCGSETNKIGKVCKAKPYCRFGVIVVTADHVHFVTEIPVLTKAATVTVGTW